ncbi:MAG: DUF5702 domain-containing protein [Eubacteriales bacterium]|nr:DUF5702 domain-containing protein [Eubacteriales bacterium]
MTFFKRSCRRRAVFKKKAQITVWMSLCFLVFLALYLICLESVRKQSARRRAEQEVENGLFSLFSEYEPHLLEEYGLFYLDTSFRTGTERTDELCSHLWSFMEENTVGLTGKPIENVRLMGINVDELVRATDGDGAVFYRQAVRAMKQRVGAAAVEDWILQAGAREEQAEASRVYQEDYDSYRGAVVDYEDEEDELEGEAFRWDGLADGFVFSMAVPGGAVVSDRSVSLTGAPSRRTLSRGAGAALGDEDGIIQKQWFISYLCEYMKNAPDLLPKGRPEGYLDYQMEYILCGHGSDRANLEQVILELLLLREGVNYAFLLTHAEYQDQAELLAYALAGLTGNEGLVQAVKHLILLGWAYGESLTEVRQLLQGYELALVKGDESWQVPLWGLLGMIGDPGRYDIQKNRQSGLDYEAYLRMLLTLLPARTLAMRSLDVIEGELQLLDGGEKLHVDHCVESLNAQVWMDGIYLERTYGYE